MWRRLSLSCLVLFFFNDTATTEIYTLSLHDALPISAPGRSPHCCRAPTRARTGRSEEHTSELQSLAYLVCRLLLEKKKQHNILETTTRLVVTLHRQAAYTARS